VVRREAGVSAVEQVVVVLIYSRILEPSEGAAMRAKQFFYVSAGILLLIVAYSVASHRAEAQGGGSFVGVAVNNDEAATIAITANGDIYARNRVPRGTCGGTIAWGHLAYCTPLEPDSGWQLMGNVLGGTIATTPATMSGVKQEYRK
jgi:hypothetical protein